jgi:YVTN family beta-propeller protein
MWSRVRGTDWPTIDIGQSPSGVAIAPDGDRAYVATYDSNNQYRGDVSVIDTVTNQVITTISVPGGNPKELTVSPDGSRLYVTIQGGYVTVIAIAAAGPAETT